MVTITKLILENDPSAALKVLCEHCNDSFLTEMFDELFKVNQARIRKQLYLEALEAHRRGWYHLTINALVGQIEGIITDFLAVELRGANVDLPGSYGGKFRKFKEVIESVMPAEEIEERILQSLCDFLISPDTMLQRFNVQEWDEPLASTAFPSRHRVQHGNYVPEYYTHENSIKMFLVIQSIYWCISCFNAYRSVRREAI